MKSAIRTSLIILGLLVLFVSAALGARVWLHYQYLEQPLKLDGDYVLNVPQGSNLTRVLAQLEREGIIPSALDLRLYARFNQDGTALQAGEYLLQSGLDGRALLRKLASGEVILHQLRLLEGWTIAQALAEIHSNPAITPLLRDVADLRERLHLEQDAEGLFFPDTYTFVRGTSDLDLLKQAHELMSQELARAWAEHDAGLPYVNAYDLLIMASIIEKETAVADERPLIAGVFVRRLQQGMRLQTDPTVIYGLGAAFDGNLTRANLQSDTPWNTYTRDGLPPTPIALPGRAALLAAAHPDDSSALYFVAKGDGSHYFSANLREHNAAVRRYQQGGQ
ncbi:MAG: endolytic transglycosylase MltG [Pseudomonadales bacterium]|jgi:UPF0755 protein|nr:endolytic transglycosylase MltG [Pseudomonadales bacterium]